MNMGHHLYKIVKKLSGRIENGPLVGGVKSGKNDVKVRIHEPFEQGSYFFIGLLKTMHDNIYETFRKITLQL